jgi:hypothetical protein
VKPLGYYWAGKSILDNSDIIVVFTGFSRDSKNTKTGAMIQSWILPHHTNPVDAQRSGADYSICGSCPRRPSLATGAKRCYVKVARAPLQIWKSYHTGRYLPLPESFSQLRSIFSGRVLRLGAYGDPAAVPSSLWASIAATGLAGHTGYTHQWRIPSAQALKALVMASCDSEMEAMEAQSNRWRTFRVSNKGDYARMRREISCPASKESGHRLTCSTCFACSGNLFGQANVVIQAH